MARPYPDRNRPALDEAALRALALRYLGRFATTRAKLRTYLARKVAERGWSGERPPDLDALVERMCDLGYVDDRGFGAAKVAALARRGLGARRQADALRVAGLDRADADAVRKDSAGDALETALTFAQRRRFGPFSAAAAGPDVQRRQVAAMVRAGHPPGLAWRIVKTLPGAEIEP